MYIEIADYIIRDYDKSNLVLIHKVPVKNPKSPRFGQVKPKEVGYYPNLEMALNRLKNELIAQTDVDTVEALLGALHEIGTIITEAVQNVTIST